MGTDHGSVGFTKTEVYPNIGMTPSEIVRQLDQHVVGQDEAKKILAVAVYWHFRKAARAAGRQVRS